MLAEHLGCPLKIFGAKKLPQPAPADLSRSGVTGPLVPHKREDIGPQRVKLFAQSVKLASPVSWHLAGPREGRRYAPAGQRCGSGENGWRRAVV